MSLLQKDIYFSHWLYHTSVSMIMILHCLWVKNVALHGYNIIFTKHFCNWWQRRWISMQKLLPHHTTQPVLVNKSSHGLITSNLGYFNCKLLHCVSLRRQWDAAEYRRSNQVTNIHCYLTTGPCNRHIPEYTQEPSVSYFIKTAPVGEWILNTELT
jgi:hypothetical protein